jgi:glycosyltransferase involved in cell wall biosynthesis
MNILLLTSTFPASKDDVIQHPFQLEFIDLLRKGNHTVTVLTHAREDIHEKVREDLDIVWFPWRRVNGRLAEIDFFKWKHLLALLSLVYNGVTYTGKLIARRKIDLVICLWIIPSGLYIYINRLLRISMVPYALWSLGSDINKYRSNLPVRLLLKKIIRKSSGVFADGFELCESVREISGKRCEFLPTFRTITPTGSGTRTGAGCAAFLFVGRHAKVKGIDVLIHAIIGLQKSHPHLSYHVVVAGDGELTPAMRQLVAENHLQHLVQFAGRVQDDALSSLYEQSDCVIIPSRSESIPVVFTESLQYNKPMIVTDVGDMGVLGRKYEVARVVASDDAMGLAQAIRAFIEEPFRTDPEKRSELLSLLTMKNSAHKIYDLISQLEAK